MKSRLLVLFCLFFMMLGCSKNNNQAGPSIKLETYSSEVKPDQTFDAKFSYTSKSGNISGDSLVIIYHRYNASKIPDGEDRGDYFLTFLPETPNATKAEFSTELAWSDISYGINGENDTVDFSFVLIDLQGNSSDTVKTGRVIVTQE